MSSSLPSDMPKLFSDPQVEQWLRALTFSSPIPGIGDNATFYRPEQKLAIQLSKPCRHEAPLMLYGNEKTIALIVPEDLEKFFKRVEREIGHRLFPQTGTEYCRSCVKYERPYYHEYLRPYIDLHPDPCDTALYQVDATGKLTRTNVLESYDRIVPVIELRCVHCTQCGISGEWRLLWNVTSALILSQKDEAGSSVPCPKCIDGTFSDDRCLC